MSTTPNQPQEPRPEPEQSGDEAQSGDKAAEAHDALRDLEDKPRADEVGETAYSAVPPPLQQPQPSPYQQQYQSGQQPPYGQQQPQYGGSGQYPGQYGPYQAPPPPPQYGQPYGYPASELPPGMPPLADWGQRATAFILDNGVAIAAGWIAGGTRGNTIDVVFGLTGMAGLVWAVLNAVRAGREGQSYGKRVMGIRLARLADGQPIGAGLGFLRLFLNWILWVACILPGVLNLLWPLWDRKHQTWSDKVAKSVVVKTR
jgi:uncharacterized RDD family membrane protein YckC